MGEKEEEECLSYVRERESAQVFAFCPLPCREQRRLFSLRKVLWPDGEEIVRGAVTGVDLLRQGRIRI